MVDYEWCSHLYHPVFAAGKAFALEDGETGEILIFTDAKIKMMQGIMLVQFWMPGERTARTGQLRPKVEG